jgi:hypothetical protein
MNELLRKEKPQGKILGIPVFLNQAISAILVVLGKKSSKYDYG